MEQFNKGDRIIDKVGGKNMHGVILDKRLKKPPSAENSRGVYQYLIRIDSSPEPYWVQGGIERE